jgi:lipopolysaccharide/colanic/teichoic acid biosynthesis glycosyltransferase
MTTGTAPAATPPRELLQMVFARLDNTVRAALAESDSGPPPSDLALWRHLDEHLPPPGRRRYVGEAVRRAFDLIAAFILLILAAPLIGLLALAISMSDGGTPFFAHERLGRGGKRFRCWKLRTMRRDTEDGLSRDRELWLAYVAEDFKIRNADDRITRIGRVLRSTYLDELPQLWNVLRGQMTLVGPRPVISEELIWYGPLADEFLSLRPGVSGAWQLTDHVPYPERAYVELAYVRSRSLLLDLSVVLRTICVMVTRADLPVRRLSPPTLSELGRQHEAREDLVEAGAGSVIVDG